VSGSDGREAQPARSSEPTNTEGTGYGCACMSRNARECMLMRYGAQGTRTYECCECLCHQWDDQDD